VSELSKHGFRPSASGVSRGPYSSWMDRYTVSGAIATVTTCASGYLVNHARRHWARPAANWTGASSRLIFAVIVGVALSGGLTVAAAYLPLPRLLWLKVLLLVLTMLGPWVVLWGVLKAQRWRLNETCRSPRTAQSLLHWWLTAQIGGTMAISYLRRAQLAHGWNDISFVLALLMGLGLLFLPALRHETLRLWSPQAHVVIGRVSARVSGVIFGLLWLWAYLSPVACPHRQCQAGGSYGVMWALAFSIGSAWLIATLLVQFGSILRWLDDRSRNPGPPPPWLRRLVHAIRRPQAA
jgi:hypothetical protein